MNKKQILDNAKKTLDNLSYQEEGILWYDLLHIDHVSYGKLMAAHMFARTSSSRYIYEYIDSYTKELNAAIEKFKTEATATL